MPISAPSDITGLTAWIDSKGSLWQDISRTTPASADGDPIGGITDASGNSVHASQGTSGSRPTRQTDANGVPVIRMDGTDDYLSLGQPAILNTLQDGDYTFVFFFRMRTRPPAVASLLLREQFADSRIWLCFRGNAGSTADNNKFRRHAANGTKSKRIIPTTGSPASVAYSFKLTGTNTGNEQWYYGGSPCGGSTGATVPAVNTARNWTIGADSGGGNYRWNWDLYGFLAYAAELTAAEVLDLEAWAETYYGFGERTVIVCDGNSLVEGSNSTHLNTVTDQLFEILAANGTLPPHAVGFSLGVGGQTIEQMRADLATEVYPLATGDRNVYFGWEGTNALSGGGQTPAQAAASYEALFGEVKSNGFDKAVVTTTIPRTTDARANNNINSLNSLVLANYAAWGVDAVADPTLRAEFDDPADTENTTYYNGDKTHLTDAGYNLIGTDWATAFEGLTFDPGGGPSTVYSNTVTSTTLTLPSGSGEISGTALLEGIGNPVHRGSGEISATTGIAGVGFAPSIIPSGSGSVSGVITLIGVGFAPATVISDVGVHVDGEHYQQDATHTITSQVGIVPIILMGDIHNHGLVMLVVSSANTVNAVNCEVTGESGIPGVYAQGELREFTLTITPLSYGAYSFDLVIESDDTDTPVLTITFEGITIDPATLTGLMALLTADVVIDNSTKPYKVIWYAEGTNTILMSKLAYDREGGPMRSPLQQLGKLVAETLYADQSSDALKLLAADIEVDFEAGIMYWHEQGTENVLMQKALTDRRNTVVTGPLQQFKSIIT